MKQLVIIVPVVLLFALVVFMFGCNQADDRAVTGSTKLAQVVIPAVEVEVNIVPHNPDNRVNCTARSRLLAVAIMSEGGFDAMDVDHATVEFEGATEAHIDPETGEPVRHEIDVDEDGDLDLVLHFELAETYLTCESDQGCLTGETYGGVEIYGCDIINMFWR